MRIIRFICIYMSRKRQINIDKGQAQIASDRTKKSIWFLFFFFFVSRLIIKRIEIDRCSSIGFADSFVISLLFKIKYFFCLVSLRVWLIIYIIACMQRWHWFNVATNTLVSIYPVPVFAYVDHNKLFRRRNGRLTMDRRWIRHAFFLAAVGRDLTIELSNRWIVTLIINQFVHRTNLFSRLLSLGKKNSNEHYAEYRGRRSGGQYTGFISFCCFYDRW